MGAPDLVVWDLDGTVADSQAGILLCLHATLVRYDRDAPDETLRAAIGPPLDGSFEMLGFSGRELREAVDHYRGLYDEVGVDLAHPYAGVVDTMRELAERGVTQRVATAKRVDFARRMLGAFAVSDLLDDVAGATLDGHVTAKSEILARALNGWRPPVAWMVGDRRYDVEADLALGVSAVGALWGYGSRDELVAAGAHWLVATPEDLLVEPGASPASP
ncbi:MAG: HAD hydrolase-like protein [Acidimicrobiales bacterium]